MSGGSLNVGQEVGIVLLALCGMAVGSWFWFRYDNQNGLITTRISLRRAPDWTPQKEDDANRQALEYQFSVQAKTKRWWPLVALIALAGVILIVL